MSVALTGTGLLLVCDIDVNPLSLGFGSVAVGSTATLSTTIGNTGTADCTVSGLTVSGSADFALNPGAPATPFTVAPGATVDVPVDYTPAEAGDDAGSLAIASNDPDENPVSVALTGSGFQTGAVDLDIHAFRVTRNTSVEKAQTKPIEIKLAIRNEGTVDEPRMATVVGMQNGSTVYSEMMMVSDALNDEPTTWLFPSYTPTAAGDILWTATVQDDDPDDDTATAVTTVKR